MSGVDPEGLPGWRILPILVSNFPFLTPYLHHFNFPILQPYSDIPAFLLFNPAGFRKQQLNSTLQCVLVQC